MKKNMGIISEFYLLPFLMFNSSQFYENTDRTINKPVENYQGNIFTKSSTLIFKQPETVYK